MKIFVVRHGETEWNKVGKVQGRTDVPLNHEGIRQAKETSKLFDEHELDALITSPLSRAKETGKILASKAIVHTTCEDPLIIEKSYGVTEGWKVKERYRVYPNGHAPQEESFKIVRKRMRKAIEAYATQFQKDVLVVSHGAAIAAMIKELEPALEQEFLRIENLSITIIDSKTLKILAWNLDHEHAKNWLNGEKND